MLRRIQVVLVYVCLFLFFFVSLIPLLQMIPWGPVSRFGELIAERISPEVQFFVLLAAIVMIVAIGVLEVRRLRQVVLTIKEGEEGTVTIVESAITRYIRQVAAEIESVRGVRSEITSTAQGLVVRLFVEVSVTDTLPRIEQTIRSRVREALEQTLGVGGVAAINVVIEGFQKVAPRGAEPGSGGEVKLTGETSASPGGAATALRWGRSPQRAEAEEAKSPDTGSDKIKASDGTIEL